MSLVKFESMLKTNNVYFFDATEFEEIIHHYLEIGKHSLAKKAIKLSLEQHPTSVALKLLKVELLIFENNMSEAVKLLNKIEVVEPNNDEVFIQKAAILSKKNNHIEAIKMLKQSLEFVEDPVEVWAMIGMEYLYLDDYENARLNFVNCIEVDFEDYSSLYNIMYCFEMEELYEEAIAFLNSYIDKNPYSEVAWHQLGRQYFELSMFKEALTCFDYAVIIDDSFIGGYLEKAKTLEELKRYEEAIENYLITLRLDDPTAFAYVRIGECFEKLNNKDMALQYYKKAVHEDPLLDRGWLLLTEFYCKADNDNKAMYYIEKALEVDDTNVLYWRKYANINIRLDFYEEAAKAFQACINLGDIEIEVYVALVDVLTYLGEYEEALKVLIKAKRTYREFAEIEYRFFGLFMVLNKTEYSITHLKNGLAIDYEYHKAVKDLYSFAFKNTKVKQIITNYKKIIR